MNQEFNPPVPSLQTLFKSCLWAVTLAIVILLTAVLPAEYDVDPTGLGEKLGLRQLAIAKKASKAKKERAKHVESSISMKEITPEEVAIELKTLDSKKMEMWQDTVTLIIPPLKGLEYKFYFHRGQEFDFAWETDGKKLYFDFHGDPKGNAPDDFTSFKIDTLQKYSGSLAAPFAGKIGWYWENKSRMPVKVTLKTRGDYRIIGKM